MDLLPHFRRILNTLDAFIAEVEKTDTTQDLTSDYILTHLRSISGLSHDIVTLVESGRPHGGTSILVRSILESVFLLGAIGADNTFAAAKFVRALHEHCGRISNAYPTPDADLASNLKELNAVVTETAKYHNVTLDYTKPHAFSAKATADRAGMLDTYMQYYFYYSGEVHCNAFALYSRGTAGAPALNLQKLSEFVLRAIGFSVTVVPVDNPQAWLDRATTDVEALVAHIEEAQV